jgi:hypothetical protein
MPRRANRASCRRIAPRRIETQGVPSPSLPQPPGDQEPPWDVRLNEQRRASSEQALWGVPGISVAAQAFLLSIGLGSDASAAAQLIAGLLGLVTSLGTAFVIAGQGSRLQIMRLWISQQRPEMGSARLLDVRLNTRFDRLASRGNQSRISPAIIWFVMLVAFALADFTVVVAGAVHAVEGGNLFRNG